MAEESNEKVVGNDDEMKDKAKDQTQTPQSLPTKGEDPTATPTNETNEKVIGKDDEMKDKAKDQIQTPESPPTKGAGGEDPLPTDASTACPTSRGVSLRKGEENDPCSRQTTGTTTTVTPGAFAIDNPLMDDPVWGIMASTSEPSALNASVTLALNASVTVGSSTTRVTTAEVVPITVADPVDLEAGDESSDETKQTRKERKIRGCVAAIVVTLVTVVVILAFFLIKKDNQPISGSVDLSKRRADMIQILSGLTEIGAFDPDHPKASADRIAALDWMVEDDPAQLPIPTSSTDENDPLVWKLQERYVMAVFYFATNGHDWYDDYKFLSGYDVCRWSSAATRNEKEQETFGESGVEVKGIVCDERGRVVQINMWWNNLSETLPVELSFFSNTLEDLNIAGNSISGTIPSFVVRFEKLKLLSLTDNCFTGSIPLELTEIPSLESIYLNNNVDKLYGTLEPFCDGRQIVVAGDKSIDCGCCFSCNPFDYSCFDPQNNVTYSTIHLGYGAFDSNNNVMQFQKKCIAPAQLQWIEEECPCVIILGTDLENRPLEAACSNCNATNARPSHSNVKTTTTTTTTTTKDGAV